MAKDTIQEARHKVMNCSKQYQKSLENNEFLIVFRDRKDNGIKFIELVFLARNYQHLTGINMIDEDGNVLDHHAEDFYRKCVENQLRISEIGFREEGMSHLKLQALDAITRFTSITKIAGDSNGNQPYLVVDKLVGGVNFCLGLRIDGDIGKYVPVSALQKDIKELTLNPSQVLFIMERCYGDSGRYKKIRHVAKGLNLTNIVLPEDVVNMISLEEYVPKEKDLIVKEEKK